MKTASQYPRTQEDLNPVVRPQPLQRRQLQQQQQQQLLMLLNHQLLKNSPFNKQRKQTINLLLSYQVHQEQAQRTQFPRHLMINQPTITKLMIPKQFPHHYKNKTKRARMNRQSKLKITQLVKTLFLMKLTSFQQLQLHKLVKLTPLKIKLPKMTIKFKLKLILSSKMKTKSLKPLLSNKLRQTKPQQ